MELRHICKIELNNKMSVDEKMIFLQQLKTEFDIEYLDIISMSSSSSIIANFKKVSDGSGTQVDELIDTGSVELYDFHMYFKVEYSFDLLVLLHTFAVTTLGSNVKDMLVWHNENPNGSPTA